MSELTLYYKYFPLTDGPFSDGMTKAIHGLVRGLHRAGASVTIITESAKPTWRISRYGYALRAFAARASGQSFRLGADLKQFLLEAAPDNLFLLNGIFSPQVFSVGQLLSRRRVPYIIVPHDPYNAAMFRKSALRKNLYWYVFERRLLQRAIAVQVLDARHGLFLENRGIKTPVIEVQNGFDGAELEAAMSIPSPGISETVNFYYLGRIDVVNKGLDLLLDAFTVFSQGKPVQLTFQGPGERGAKELLQRARRLGIQDRVTYLPPDFATRSSTLIAKYDVFCLPSRYEGFGLAALEAMLAARPVLVSTIGGIAPHVDAARAGVVVEPSCQSILAGLERLWEERATWARMGVRGQQQIQTNLQWDSIAQSALAAYKRITDAYVNHAEYCNGEF
jgi:glycosyltransferase involved in cell wall biosynthesis